MMTRCFLKLLLLSCLILAFTEAKKGKSSEVVHISDIKDWKKELRTKKNVLALFTKVCALGSANICDNDSYTFILFLKFQLKE